MMGGARLWPTIVATVLLLGCVRGAHSGATGGSPPGPRELAVMGDRLDGRQWLAHDAQIAQSFGAGPLQIAVTDMGGDGDRVGGFVAIPADQCVLAYARGSQGVEDLDLYAYSDEGTTLASDEAADPDPAVILCPPHPTRAYFVARIASGRGVVSIGVHALPPSAAARVGKALGARGRPGEELGRIEPWPGLDDKVGAHRRLVGGRWEEVRRVAIQADARAATRLSVALDGGRCLDVFVIPGEEFGLLDVTLLDADDRVLVRAPSSGHERTAIVCSPVPMSVAIEIRPHTGQGLCAVILSRSELGAERVISGPFYVYRIAPTSDLSIERAQRAKSLRGLGYAEPTALGSGTADVGRRLSFPVNLPGGCARFDVIGGRPVAGLTADIWDASSRLMASGSAGDGPTLFACGNVGKGRIDVEALNRPGPFTIEMRRERVASPTLVTHSLAAGRLLTAMGVRGEPGSAGVDDIKVLALDPASQQTVDLKLPEGRCGEIFAALDAGGAGLDLRVVDAQSGEEFFLIRARTTVEGRVCAAGHARLLRAELRLGTGAADALLALRLLPLAPP